MRAALAERLHREIGFNKREARDLVGSIIEEVCAALGEGEEVKLSELGHFRLHHCRQRPGRNPRTGEPVPVPAHRAVSFYLGPKLKTQLGASNG